MVPIPTIQRFGARPALFCEGKPFLAIGAEWDFRNSIAPERSEFLYEHAAAMGCTTAFVPVLWSQVEAAPGRFAFDFVDRQIQLAEGCGLKLVLLWFGCNRGGSLGFLEPGGRPVSQVPQDIVADPAAYRRACTPDGRPQASLCPACAATLSRETAAFRSLLAHIRDRDQRRTVAMMQVENEVSTPDAGRLQFPPRCCCSACNEAFARSALAEREFGDRGYGDYVASLVEAGAAEYPLPMYVNFVGTPRPGENVAYFLGRAPHLASCAPDIYSPDTGGFVETMRAFASGRNVPLVAETSSNSGDPTDANLYAAVAEGAVAFVMWAIDCAYGWGAWEEGYADRVPLVDREGKWSALAVRMRDELRIVSKVTGPLLAWRGTDRLDWFAADGREIERPVELRGVRGSLKCGPRGRGLLILTGSGELAAAGHDFTLAIRDVSGCTASSGAWDGDLFVSDGGTLPTVTRTADGFALNLSAPAVVRVRWEKR